MLNIDIVFTLLLLDLLIDNETKLQANSEHRARQMTLAMLDDGKSECVVAEFFNVGKGTINRIKSSRDAIQLHVDDDVLKSPECMHSGLHYMG